MPLPEVIAYALAVLFGIRFVIVKAWYAARGLRPDMNLLMTVAVAGAIVIGEWFEAATVAFLFALSLALESWSVARARRAIAALLDLAPPIVRLAAPRRIGSGRARGRSQARRPLYCSGRRAHRAGRTRRGRRQRGEPGAHHRRERAGRERARRRGLRRAPSTATARSRWRRPKSAENTMLARIIRMVEEAHARRAPSEQWVERFARVYTPAVMALALLVFLVPPLGSRWSMGRLVLSCARPARDCLPLRAGDLDAGLDRRFARLRRPAPACWSRAAPSSSYRPASGRSPWTRPAP